MTSVGTSKYEMKRKKVNTEQPFGSNDDGSAKLVFDGDLSITAIFTSSAIRAAQASNKSYAYFLDSASNWNDSLIVVKHYVLNIHLADQHICLIIRQKDGCYVIFSVFSMDLARVKYKAHCLWLKN
ncbi:hypothetical protein LSH36_923g01055, partial [Paralvinella palmiformis]